ncbi:MAG TPA: M28 family peptidase [Allosphingosinicella sp.]|nr:M28 family peptidase [Allosphingosinicella sp.]
MFLHTIRAAAPFLLLLSTPLVAQTASPIDADDLMTHIRVIASDEYQGRMPGTEGERLTTAYIVEQLRARGVEPAGTDGGWFQGVPLVERSTGRHAVHWSANNRDLPFNQDEVLLLGKDESERIANAPVIFAGHGARMPDRGIDQLAGADLRGAVVLILLEGPQVEGFPSLVERRQAVTDAGAAAVIAIIGSMPWERVKSVFAGQGTTQLETAAVAEITGTMPLSAAQALVGAAGGDFGRLLNDQPGSSFRAVSLPLRASIDVTTNVNRYVTNNVVGRIRGSGNSGESLLFLGHWDHLGICRPEGIADRICNGAVDNASGIATMIEMAERLSASPRPARDILFLATTAEEKGLLGAEYFAANPVVPAQSIVAAVNMDTVAVHRAGLPVAMIGRGILPALDRVVDETARAMGRQLDTDEEANVMVQRQDGWKLNQAGIPTIMVGGSFSDMNVLGAFLQSRYHSPDDQDVGSIQLDGAVEDANLMVSLARRLADPAVYQRPRG